MKEIGTKRTMTTYFQLKEASNSVEVHAHVRRYSLFFRKMTEIFTSGNRREESDLCDNAELSRNHLKTVQMYLESEN